MRSWAGAVPSFAGLFSGRSPAHRLQRWFQGDLLRGPKIHIALTQKDRNNANDFFGIVGGVYGLIEELESTYDVCHMMHLFERSLAVNHQ